MTIAPTPEVTQEFVLFDGECNFCRNQIGWLRWLDRAKRLQFLSLHDSKVATDFPDLSYEQLMEQIWLVNRQGLRVGGADAIRYLAIRIPLLFPLVPFFYFPGSMPLWRWLYRLVAKYRYRIAGRNCENGACQLHLDRLK